MKKFLTFISIILFALLFCLIAYYYLLPKPKTVTLQIQQPDEFFINSELETLDGRPISLNKFLGKPIVVNFWATWCLPCVAEMSSFEVVRQEKLDDVHFILMSEEPNAKIQNFADKKGYQLTYLKSKKPLSEYNISKIPQTFFYDKKGVLTKKYESSIYSKIIREELDKMNLQFFYSVCKLLTTLIHLNHNT